MFKIDIRSSTPIYEQLAEQVKRGVIQGLLKPGDALPSVRRLAADTGVNPNTVAKAYRELERQNVIVTIRGRGTVINDIPVNLDTGAAGKLKPYLTELIYAGKTKQEILDIVSAIYDELKGEN
ncbi:MAG: GntR family transcriptional regulator [Firmicutes bacterium]|nr:GntR family transcriptional regulator [Bacillota bacterium]